MCGDGVGAAVASWPLDLAAVAVACEHLEAEALPGLGVVAPVGHAGNDASRAGRILELLRAAERKGGLWRARFAKRFVVGRGNERRRLPADAQTLRPPPLETAPGSDRDA
jgi:hypothetical protein